MSLANEPRIQAAFQAACEAELAALKPGNVHRFAAGHGMTMADFQRSAAAAAPCIARLGCSTGERILAATEATWKAVGCNTNLGIVLLCAPLAVAAEQGFLDGSNGPDRQSPGGVPADVLRAALTAVLGNLTVDDAMLAYRAIALANPAGLGSAAAQDVSSVPTVTLRAAMQLAAEQDRIASQYANDFTDIFDFALPFLRTVMADGRSQAEATTGLYLAILARSPDTHLLRKFGDTVAQTVSEKAREASEIFASAPWPQLFDQLLVWDKSLKSQGFNPGTSADLTVATLFVQHLADD